VNRIDFINWLKNESGLRQVFDNSDEYWEELSDYANYDFDNLDVYENSCEFIYDRNYWGGAERIREEYTFEDFIYTYENYNLKN